MLLVATDKTSETSSNLGLAVIPMICHPPYLGEFNFAKTENGC